MGWAIYESKSVGTPLRWAGYGVPAYCDHPKCNEEIDRGVSYVCGSVNSDYEDRGCKLHFCMNHLDHRQLCANCARNRKPFKAKPDHPEWVKHVLTDESWKQWRDENPEYAKLYQPEGEDMEAYKVPQRRVVCAACIEGEGNLVIAPRHWDEIMHRINKKVGLNPHKAEQGFIDQWGNFMSREEALTVAIAAGQIIKKTGNPNSKELFSEDIY